MPATLQKKGRVDILVRGYAERVLRDLGARHNRPDLWPQAEPIVDRLVRAYLPSRAISLEPVDIADALGLLPRPRRNVARRATRRLR